MGSFLNISLVVLLLLVSISNVVDVEAFLAEDLVECLPGQPKVTFRQFAGYVDVDVKNGRNLFYYFVEADVDPHNKPLTLWLNGGPGCSSVGEGFKAIGPFNPTGDGRGLQRNLMSWNGAGVGWSYSNTTSDYECGDASTAKDMHIFMMNWFEQFPEFKSREFFLTGVSYAGHYIPQLADALLDHNAHSNGFKFNNKGVAIGNPLLRLDRNVPSIYEFLWSHGMISDEMHLTIMNKCDFDNYVFKEPHNISNSCNEAIDEANKIVGFLEQRDVIVDVCDSSIAEQELRLRKMAKK